MKEKFKYALKRRSTRYHRVHTKNITPYEEAEKLPLKYDEEWNVFVSSTGDVFTPQENGLYKRKAYKHAKGYLYLELNFLGKTKGYRVHRLVAQHWIPNPDKLPLVGHKNNIKDDNRVENLYWTTNKANIQKAHDDGLNPQDKGFADSQSKPVACYDKETQKVTIFGSRSIAAKETGVSKSTVTRHVNEEAKTRKRSRYIFADYQRYLEEGIEVFVF